MEKVKVSLPDGSQREYDLGIVIGDIIGDIGSGLLRDAIAARVDGELVDLSYVVRDDIRLEVVTVGAEGSLDILRHSAAHIMAQAVKRLFPSARYAIGPATRDGFYYDFDVSRSFSVEDLERIELEMQSIVKEGYNFKRREVGIDKAIDYFRLKDDVYKVEILEGIRDTNGIDEVSIYDQGDFTDLCRGPHIPSTSHLRVFKLLSIAGAYWRGDSSNRMLQRVYGTAFFNKKDLSSYIARLEEAKKRDHRKLGKELQLFSFHEEGSGFPFWHPRGTIIYDVLVDLIRGENQRRGYKEVKTPIILHESLWQASGHYDNFKDNMYFTKIDDRNFAVKPMNCPGHCLIYKANRHSYRELPIKFAEFGLVHRHELSGVLHGLFRVRNFTQDDAHIYCLSSQVKEEVVGLIDYTLYIYRLMGFNDFTIYVATKPDKHIGSEESWVNATSSLVESLEHLNIVYKIKEGEGAFYGPKIEFNIKDSLERDWQCGTIQVDFSMAKKLDLYYEGSDGKRHNPVMIHRAILGSLERFIGILIEHYAGKLPLWLSPIQVRLIPILEKHFSYAKEVEGFLMVEGIRVESDLQGEKLGYKIRKSQLEKIPYMIILGDDEVRDNNLSIRSRDRGELGRVVIERFIEQLKQEILLT